MTNLKALKIAQEYARITEEENICVRNEYSAGYYEITIYTIERKYEFYVDAETGEVSGFNAEPFFYSGITCYSAPYYPAAA